MIDLSLDSAVFLSHLFHKNEINLCFHNHDLLFSNESS